MIRLFAAILFLIPTLLLAQVAAKDDAARRLYKDLWERASLDRLKADALEISKFGSRMAGSEGEWRTREWMTAQLQSLGGRVRNSQLFPITVPQQPRGILAVGGKKFPVYALWPNLVTTSNYAGAGIAVYGGDGSPSALSGKQIRGRIVFLEFASGRNWRWIAEMGAAGIVFLPPANMEGNPRLEAEQKFAEVPVRIPRFYLPTRPAGSVDGQDVIIDCVQEWTIKHTENIEFEFSGSGDPILLTVATDAISVAPNLAFGGEGAGSLAATLELVRLLRDLPNRRPIRVVLLSGKNLALAGSRAYVRNMIDRKESILLVASIDLVTQSQSLGVFSRGLFYEPREEVVYGVRVFTTNLRDHATLMAEAMGFADSRVCLQDVTNNSDGRTWNKALPGKYALDSEPFLQAGINAISFSGVDDARPLLDTPFDTVEKVNFENLRSQTARIAACLARALIDSTNPSITDRYRLNLKPSTGRTFGLSGGFALLAGKTVAYDPERGFLPSVDLPGSLVTLRGRAKSFFGVRGAIVEMSNGAAEYQIDGVPPTTSYIPINRGPAIVGAYRVDNTGKVTMAAAEGLMGSDDYPIRFEVKTSVRRSPIVLFPCDPIDIYGLRDPQDQTLITYVDILDAVTNGRPATYGFTSAWPTDPNRPEEVEDAAVAFLKPGTRIKLVAGGDRLALTGGTPPGIGPEWIGPLAYRAAQDLYALNDERIKVFASHRILSPYASATQEEVGRQIKAAEAARDRLDWAEFRQRSEAAWALSLRSYPLVRSTANDVVNGVVFYLLLLLPFSVFMERLLFGFHELSKRLTGTLGVFILSFLALRFLHPAFAVVPNPWMIFIAFIMGALSLGVAVLIIGKFETGLSEDRAARTGLKEVDLRRGSAMAVSFALALSNLRRRKVRTWLTAATLMVTTFLVIGFVGMVPEVRVLANPTPKAASYSGILLRTPAVDPLDPSLVALFSSEFDGKVARRATTYGADSGGMPTISLYGTSDKVEMRALTGFDSLEPTPIKNAVTSGRWLEPEERGVVIVPEEARAKLGETCRILGRQFRVIGGFDPKALAQVRDLDGDGLMPPDFALSRTEQTKTQTATAAFRSYLRLDPAVCAIIPAADLLELNGQVRSIAAPLADEEVTPKLDNLMPRLRMNLYGGADGRVSQFSAQVGTANAGFGLVIFQLAIAAIFVLNTMLASVHERKGEIGILSAVGLAPNQISHLFFAESTVYGVIGSVGGYLIAQAVGQLVPHFPGLAGLTLNFSSTAAVLAAVLVFAAVLLSTIYPARIAARTAGPDGLRNLDSAPEGDVWHITLPFTVSGEDVENLSTSFTEWFRSHEAFSVGIFVAQNVTPTESGVEAGVSLVPFDLGVSQHVTLRMIPAEHVPGAFDMAIEIRRLSGDARSWQSLNRTFLSQIRRHFLTWQASR